MTAVRDRRLEGRDGADAGRDPARDRRLPARPRRRARRRAASRRSSASRRTTRPSARYTEIADFFVPHGYAVVLQDMRDRHRSRGDEASTSTARRRTPGADGYDTIEWIAAQPWATAAPAWSAARTPAITQIRTALERAAAPDRDLARRRADEHATTTRRARAARCSCTCSGRSTSTPPTRRRCRATRSKQEDVWDDLRNLRAALLGAGRGSKGELALRHVPALDETLENYATRGAYDEWWAQQGERLHALLAPSTPTSRRR